MAAHRDGEIADVGVLAAAVIAVEVGVQNVHHDAAFLSIHHFRGILMK